MYTDGSVSQNKSGWGYTIKQGAKTVHEDSAAHQLRTSSMTMEMEAVTHALWRLSTRNDSRRTHAVILTDSMSLLQKVQKGTIHSEWAHALRKISLGKITWMYCPGHAGVKGNERADRLAGSATVTTGLTLGRAEVLRQLRTILRAKSPPQHHSLDRLEERGIERGSGRWSTLRDKEKAIFNQTNIGTISKATLGKLLKDGAERVWAFPSAEKPS